MNRQASVVTKDQLIDQFHAVATETEQLLKSVATAGGEQAGALRESAERSLASVKDRLPHGLHRRRTTRGRRPLLLRDFLRGSVGRV